MKTMLLALALVSGAAAAEETERPVVVISTAGGASAGAATAGGEVGVYNQGGRFRYGVSALVTVGDSQWAGGLLNGRWSFLDAQFSPYLGLGLGIFSARRGALDLGVQPTAAFDAGIEYRHVFAGARALVPLSRTEGDHPHDVWGFGTPALLAQLGFRL
jgi:hypothetical protein